MTPKPLTETDLIDVEEQYSEDAKKRSDSLWDVLIANIGEKKFESVADLADSSAYLNIPDMDDITTEVNLKATLIV